MNHDSTMRDERTTAVENASYRWAYLVLSFGLLLDVAYRGLVRQEAGWDLLALVIVGGFVATIYQSRHSILSRRWALLAIVTILVAAATAAVIALLR